MKNFIKTLQKVYLIVFLLWKDVNHSELGTLEWITFNPNYLIRISTMETFNFSP